MAKAARKFEPTGDAKPTFQWDDPFLLEAQLSDEERLIRDSARGLCAGKAAAARHRGVSRGEDRPGNLSRDGRARAARADASRRLWLRRRLLCLLRARRARGRAGRFRLSLDDERAVVARHVSDLGLRRRKPAAKISAEARDRRMDRLFWADRAGRRLRSRQHDDARGEGRRRLPPLRRENVDLQCADRRRLRRLGEAFGQGRRA